MSAPVGRCQKCGRQSDELKVHTNYLRSLVGKVRSVCPDCLEKHDNELRKLGFGDLHCQHCGMKTDELTPQISFMNKKRTKLLTGQNVKVCMTCLEAYLNFLRDCILPKERPQKQAAKRGVHR